MKRRIIFIVLIFLLIAAATAAGFRIFYLTSEAAGEIIAVKRDIAEIERKEANIKMLEDLILSIAAEENKITNILIDSETLVLFIEKLETAARDSGVFLEIESATLSAAGDGSLPQFRLKTKGSFGENFRYLNLIESMPFQIEINDAVFAALTDEKGGKFWELKISLTLLSFLNT